MLLTFVGRLRETESLFHEVIPDGIFESYKTIGLIITTVFAFLSFWLIIRGPELKTAEVKTIALLLSLTVIFVASISNFENELVSRNRCLCEYSVKGR